MDIDFQLSLLAIVTFVFIGVFLSVLILTTRAKLVSTLPCKISINGDDTLTKFTEGGSTLLGALSVNGISVPSPCGGKATCKQCRVQVMKGGGDILETDKATFAPPELKKGWRLSCQCKVKEDMEIKLPDSLLSIVEFEGKVVSNANVATFIKELVVEMPESLDIKYQPGDYLQFHVPSYKTNTEAWKATMDEKYYSDWEKFHMFGREIEYKEATEEVIRAYSMASHPIEGKNSRFTIRIATPPFVKGEITQKFPWGICSSYAFSLKPGDTVKLSGPFGESHMLHDDRQLVFLIGGAGASFGRSHILDLFYGKNTKRKVSLWYGARSLKENIYEEEFRTLASKFENFEYKLVLSEPLEEDVTAGWDTKDPTQTNYLFKAFEEGQLKAMEEPENCLYFVCGPPLHNSSVMNLLDNYGVPRENIVLDDFGN